MTLQPPEFPDFPDAEFRTILADPPWNYEDDLPEDVGRGAAEHYDTLHTGYIMGLGEQVQQIAAPSAHLYLWTTGSFMPEAFEVVDAWGFDHKQVLTWVKVNNAPPTLPHEREQNTRLRRYMGMGRYYRNSAEFLLFATKGNRQVNREDASTTFFAERSDHSVKPEKSYRLIEQMSDGPFFEMFSRSKRAGWTAWGDEAPDTAVDVAEADGSPTTKDAGVW